MVNLLVCTAGPEPAKRSVEEVANIAETFDAKVTVLSVLPHRSQLPPHELEERGREATRIIEEAIEEKGLEVDYELRFADDVTREIVKTSEEVQSDLIVMGVGKKPKWLSFVRKDITEEIIHNASCPVLTLSEELKRSPFD